MIKKDIKEGLNLLKGKNDFNTSKYGHIYGYTNEELDLLYSILPIENNNILTISASGDQIITAAANNAKKIDAFDYNIFAIYYSKLKIASIKSLSNIDYKNFFYNYDKESLFDIKYYKIVRDYLDSEAKYFWDAMFIQGEFKYSNNNMIINFIEYPNFGNELDYLDTEIYKETQKNLNKLVINYYNCNFFKLNKYLNTKYDVIILSNIHDWLTTRQKKLFLKYIKNNLSDFLNDKGIISIYNSVNGSINEYLEKETKNNDNIKTYKLENEQEIIYKKVRK